VVHLERETSPKLYLCPGPRLDARKKSSAKNLERWAGEETGFEDNANGKRKEGTIKKKAPKKQKAPYLAQRGHIGLNWDSKKKHATFGAE